MLNKASFVYGLLVGLIISALTFYAFILSAIEHHSKLKEHQAVLKEFQKQAVEHDAATWDTDSSGNVKFRWIKPIDAIDDSNSK